MECKGAIFDMDGVLFDTERMYQQTWQELAGERGIELAGGFAKAISGTNGAYMRQVIEEYYHTADGTGIMEACMERMREKLSVHVPQKAGVREILDYLKEHGVRTAVASSSTKAQIESNLDISGIAGYFSVIVSGTEVKHGKPAPDIFLCAAERLGYLPQECIVFEDSENGIRAGHAAGCMTVLVPDLFEASPQIRPLCTKICTGLGEALEIFSNSC